MYLLVKQDAKFNRRTFMYNFPSDPRIGSVLIGSNEKMICENYEVVKENTFDVTPIKINFHFFIIILTYEFLKRHIAERYCEV